LTQFEVLKKWDKEFDECVGIYLKMKTETVYERLKGKLFKFSTFQEGNGKKN
jgi:hypothetical protein